MKYESGKGELPISVLMGYWKLSDVPLRNILDDDRDFWFEQLREARFPRFQSPRYI